MGEPPKLKLFPAIETERAGPVIAVPVSPTTWGPAKALSSIISTAASVPDSVGANETLIAHEAPGPRPVPQVFVKRKSVASLEVMLLMPMLVLSWLVRVTV